MRLTVNQPFIIVYKPLATFLRSRLPESILLKTFEEVSAQDNIDQQLTSAVGLWLSSTQWIDLQERDQLSLENMDGLKVEVIEAGEKQVHSWCWPASLTIDDQCQRLVSQQITQVNLLTKMSSSLAETLLKQSREVCLEMIGPLRALSQKLTTDQNEARELCKQVIERVEVERLTLNELRNKAKFRSRFSNGRESYSLRNILRETLLALSCPFSWFKDEKLDYEAMISSEDTKRGLLLLISQISLLDKAPSISLTAGNTDSQAKINIVAKAIQDNNSLAQVRFNADVKYVREIAECQGGTLSIQTTLSGSLKVSWSFSQAQKKEVPKENVKHNVSTKSQIWFIDDEPGVRLTVKRWLTHLGYSLEVFEEGPSLLESLEQAQTKPSLIICDADMPIMTGLEILSRVAKDYPNVKRLLYTAREPNRWVIEAFNQGVIHRFIDKSEGPEALKNCLEELLKHEEEQSAQLQALDELLEQRLISLFVQPIFSAQTRKVEATEALMRSQHPAFRGPLDILNATQLAQREFDLQKVLSSLSREIREELPEEIKLFMNIDPLVFGHPDRLDEVFSDVYPFASSIVLELTERGQLCGDAWVESVKYLRAKGFEIALDDLGAGYNSLGAVAAVSPEIIKLDISLVSNVNLSNPKREMVRLLSEYALRHQIKTVAEGIETAEEAEVCTELAIKWLQGYHLARPMPFDRFKESYININSK